MTRTTLSLLLLVGIALAGAAWARSGAPRELGEVAWQRNLDTALAQAEREQKPVFLLFQEVPGCQTCVSFGEQALSHPLLVEAIESAFVPVAIYNNRGGHDAEVLARYGEPSWNNPVVRLVDAKGQDLLPRKAGVYAAHEVGERMIAALGAADADVPTYLRAAVDELRPRDTRYATFGMHCFWSGEACLGQIPGVLESRAGFLEGREVVELRFDPAVSSYEEVLRAAAKADCADLVFVRSDAEAAIAGSVYGGRVHRTRNLAKPAPARDQKRQLRGTPYADLDLTPQQATRINSAIVGFGSATGVLSPRQQAEIRGNP